MGIAVEALRGQELKGVGKIRIVGTVPGDRDCCAVDVVAVADVRHLRRGCWICCCAAAFVTLLLCHCCCACCGALPACAPASACQPGLFVRITCGTQSRQHRFQALPCCKVIDGDRERSWLRLDVNVNAALQTTCNQEHAGVAVCLYFLARRQLLCEACPRALCHNAKQMEGRAGKKPWHWEA